MESQTQSEDRNAKTDFDPTEVRLGLYEHYKGMRYRVLGVARHSETLEHLVVYETLYDNPLGKLWIRPAKMFVESVQVNGAIRPRFRFIGQDNLP